MATLSRNGQRLVEIGEALYGPRWQGRMADALGINQNQVWRWASGQYEPSDERVEQLKAIGRERARKIMEVCGVES